MDDDDFLTKEQKRQIINLITKPERKSIIQITINKDSQGALELIQRLKNRGINLEHIKKYVYEKLLDDGRDRDHEFIFEIIDQVNNDSSVAEGIQKRKRETKKKRGTKKKRKTRGRKRSRRR
jgi:DNA-binding transcriptional MerR regulator